jgi:hypothetical protein
MNGPKHNDTVEIHQIAGHSVEIRTLEDREELRIDGVRTKFLVTDDGYNLADAAYDRPYKTLLDAVKGFFQAPERNGGGK